MRAKILTALFTAGLLFHSHAVFAAPEESGSRAGKMKERWEAKREEIAKELNLTEEQKKALADNKAKNRETRQALRAEIKEKMDTMRVELQKAELNMERINQIQGEIKSIAGQLMDTRLQGILEARKILTPEQFKQFAEKLEKGKERMSKEGRMSQFREKEDDLPPENAE